MIRAKTSVITMVMMVICATTSITVYAQNELKFVAVVSEKNLSLRQPFQVQFIVYGAKYVPDIKVPVVKGFQVNDSFVNQSSQVIGGKTLQWIDSYAKVLVMTPTRTGKFTIPVATVKINGKILQTKPVQLTVSQTGLSSVPMSSEDESPEPVVQDESELAPGESMDEKVKKNFFLKAITNKKVCYVGEPLDVTYKAYSRLNSNSQVVKRPSFPGFSVVEMVESYDNRPEVEMFNGNAFYTNLIRKVQLFPLQPGNYELDPAEVESIVHFVKPGGARVDAENKLQQLLQRSAPGATSIDHYANLKTAPVTIEVKPLPAENQPADFAGAVGQFSLETKLPEKEIRQGELVKISWQLSGSGNLQLVSLPDVEWPKGIDTSEPSVKEDLNHFVYPLTGKKTFNYAVTARDTGNYQIPPVSFSYFDPQTESYKTLKTEPISFHVAASAAQPFFATESVKNLADRPLHLYWFGGVALMIIGWITYQSLFAKKAKSDMADSEASATGNSSGSQNPSHLEDTSDRRDASNSRAASFPGAANPGTGKASYSSFAGSVDDWSSRKQGADPANAPVAGASHVSGSKRANIPGAALFGGSHKESSSDVHVVRIPVADMFNNARKSLMNDDIKGFYREVQHVLWTIAAERCDVLPSFLNKQNISFQLQKQEIPAKAINNFLTVLNECEWALYTPDHSPADMHELLENAVETSEQIVVSGDQ